MSATMRCCSISPKNAGLDRSVIGSLLASDADSDCRSAEIKAAQEMGVNGVPFFIFDQQYAVSGAQTPDVAAPKRFAISPRRSRRVAELAESADRR